MSCTWDCRTGHDTRGTATLQVSAHRVLLAQELAFKCAEQDVQVHKGEAVVAACLEVMQVCCYN